MKKSALLLLILSTLSASAFANEAAMKKALVSIGFTSFHLEKLNKNWSRFSDNGTIYYISSDGKYLTQGPIFDISGSVPKNITNEFNQKLLAPIKNQAITYKAPNQKYEVYVFSDYTCTYCKKLHSDIQSYLDKGITINYLAFPRQGINSDVAKEMQAAWNATNKQATFNALYNGEKVEPAQNSDQVNEQYNVGLSLGINGTPSIILKNGQLLSGYVPADKLLEILSTK